VLDEQVRAQQRAVEIEHQRAPIRLCRARTLRGVLRRICPGLGQLVLKRLHLKPSATLSRTALQISPQRARKPRRPCEQTGNVFASPA